MSKKFYLGSALFAAVVIVFFTGFRGTEKEQTPARQIWEYKVISTARSIGDDGWTARYEDNNLIKVNSTLEKVKEMGQQGWELVSVTAISSTFHKGWTNSNFENSQPETTPSYAGFTSEVYYYFKRPK